MNDILIIITRLVETCEVGQEEWEYIWGCSLENCLAIFDNNNTKHEFDNDVDFMPQNIKLIIFNGTFEDQYSKLASFISTIKDRNFMMAIHPGGGGNLGEAKRTLCNGMPAIKNIINDAIGYTLGCSEPSKINNEPIVDFAQNPTDDNLEKLRQFILSKIQKPHLIALSILCQGYLAAHGEERFKISDDKLQEKAENNKDTTELQNWWKPALGKNTEGKELYSELETVDENKKKDIKCLIKKIKVNDVNIEVVKNAYSKIL